MDEFDLIQAKVAEIRAQKNQRMEESEQLPPPNSGRASAKLVQAAFEDPNFVEPVVEPMVSAKKRAAATASANSPVIQPEPVVAMCKSMSTCELPNFAFS
eukprot:CAMPEP_0174696848 /NCGR_PEP_ID=MMETSP1094-20130205/2889_1 /TAXON_ID=156173 /ORGANISM="Chrysochromulina brevifilum, Strain UTEX LB 985" /LENGTH=99 /DNA_ID=CAMNT_0015893715 /DNA_START=93 /DNA_END=392 /DNA_ORIENTATION=+